MKKPISVVIIGSGFSGSLLAWILSSRGVDVAIVDAQTHPRFAIGESSTPIADLLLRQLGEKYELQPLCDLSTYGTWKKTHPRLTCGKKRGFSYYHHHDKDGFTEDNVGQRSLLAAASSSDASADTHWYRSEVDDYFFKQAILSGATPYSATSVVDIEPIGNNYRIVCGGNFTGDLIAEHIIDASGRAAVTSRLLDKPDRTDELKTKTTATYGHYRGVRSWNDYLQTHGFDTSSDPFDCDEAAQHHTTADGWTWMLRMDNDITSIGFCSGVGKQNTFREYSAFQWMMQDAVQVYPAAGEPLVHRPRLQAYRDPIVSERIWLMPGAAITLDPLHSTGIAMGIAGVQRIADRLLSRDPKAISEYETGINNEVHLLDELVSTAYAVIDHPARFHTACMIYFTAAIVSEETIQAGNIPDSLYHADSDEFIAAITQASKAIRDVNNADFLAITREEMSKWNTAGLFSESPGNRYAYTATKR